jgi:hypothetical protein
VINPTRPPARCVCGCTLQIDPSFAVWSICIKSSCPTAQCPEKKKCRCGAGVDTVSRPPAKVCCAAARPWSQPCCWPTPWRLASCVHRDGHAHGIPQSPAWPCSPCGAPCLGGRALTGAQCWAAGGTPSTSHAGGSGAHRSASSSRAPQRTAGNRQQHSRWGVGDGQHTISLARPVRVCLRTQAVRTDDPSTSRPSPKPLRTPPAHKRTDGCIPLCRQVQHRLAPRPCAHFVGSHVCVVHQVRGRAEDEGEFCPSRHLC